MAQSADDLLGDLPHAQTITPSVALAKLMETVDQVTLLTRQSAAKDALGDITTSTLRLLRRKFSSRLWMLRSLWYAEPFRLETIGRWMSRIDKETTNKLDALDAHIQARTMNITYKRKWITGDENLNPVNSSHMAEEQRPYRGGMAIHRRNSRGDTDPNNYRSMLIQNDNHRNDATYGLQTTSSCWPPVGRCHLCGFHPQRRIGTICIAYTKRCNSCGPTGHIERACKRQLGADAIELETYIETDIPKQRTGKRNQHPDTAVHTINLSHNQPGSADSGKEIQPPQDDTPDTETCNESQHNVGALTDQKPKCYSSDHAKSNREDRNNVDKGEPKVSAAKSTSIINKITNYPRSELVQKTGPPRLDATHQKNHNDTTPITCIWKKCSGAVNTLRTTTAQKTMMFLHTHKLTATSGHRRSTLVHLHPLWRAKKARNRPDGEKSPRPSTFLCLNQYIIPSSMATEIDKSWLIFPPLFLLQFFLSRIRDLNRVN